MDRAFIMLCMDLTDAAPEGAGWYIAATVDGKPVIAPISITSQAAIVLASEFHQILQAADSEMPETSPIGVVASGNSLIRSALERQLAFAEDQAKKVGIIRKKLAHTPQEQEQDD